MGRRSAVLLVICAYLAGQLAAVPHAHAINGRRTNSGHDPRPHIHLSAFGHAQHGHRHEPGHHHHAVEHHAHHAADAHNAADGHNAADAPSDIPGRNGEEHDSDAIYLLGGAGAYSLAGSGGHRVNDLQLNSPHPIAPAVSHPETMTLVASSEIVGTSCSSCPLYLTLRALRI